MSHPIRHHHTPRTTRHPTTAGPRRPRRRPLIAVTAMAAVLLAACAPATAPTPSPTPTSYQCTPETGGEPYACTAEQHADMVALDALYAEAETVYRRHMTEVFRLSSHWELAEVTPEIEATSAGPYLERMTQIIAANRANRIERTSGEPKLGWVKRLPGKSLGGSIVALWTCVDGSGRISTTMDAPKGESGIVGENRIYLRRIDGVLKLWESEVKLVESC